MLTGGTASGRATGQLSVSEVQQSTCASSVPLGRVALVSMPYWTYISTTFAEMGLGAWPAQPAGVMQFVLRSCPLATS
jgi:hypothetical protein